MDGHGDGVNGANLSQGACVCKDENTTRLPEKVCTTLSGSVSIMQKYRYRLLHVRALLSKSKRGKSEIHQVHDGSPLNSRLRNQEGTTSRTSIW